MTHVRDSRRVSLFTRKVPANRRVNEISRGRFSKRVWQRENAITRACNSSLDKIRSTVRGVVALRAGYVHSRGTCCLTLCSRDTAITHVPNYTIYLK